MRKIRKLYVQKVLPLVYDYSLSVSEMVGKLIRAVNDMADDVEENTDDIENIESTVTTLSDQTDLNTRSIDTISGKIEDIEHELDNVPTDARIEELQEGINQNASDIASLDGRVDILESQPDLSTIVSINTSNISTLQGDVSDLNTAVQNKSTVSYTRDLSSGTKIGSISIDGNTTNIYAPSAPGAPTAASVSYDNTSSGLTASNVQDVIDELNTDIGSSAGDISTLQSDMSTAQSDIYNMGRDISDLNDYMSDHLYERYENVSINALPLNGYITSSLKDIILSVPISKKFWSVNNPQIYFVSSVAKIVVRGVNGYVNSASSGFDILDTTNFSLTWSFNGIGLRLTIHSDTAFTNATNNTPVSATFPGAVNINIR